MTKNYNMGQEINILLVDDDPDDHVFFDGAMKNVQHIQGTVHSVHSGEEALGYLFRGRMHLNGEEPKPDLIVIDINMPVMSGSTLLQKIKSFAEYKDIPVFILTTTNDAILFQECKQLGAIDCFTKPIHKKQLTHIIEHILCHNFNYLQNKSD